MPHPDYRAVIIAYLSFILLGLSFAVIGVLWSPHIQTGFGQPLNALGALLLTTTLGYFTGSSVSGRLFARYSVGVILAVMLFITAAGFFGYVIAPAWEVMVLFGLVVGFGPGVLDGGMNIYFAAHYDARLMNWLHASFGIGTFLSPQLVNSLVLTMGLEWRAVYGVIVVLFVGVALVFLVTRKRWLPVRPASGEYTAAPLSQTLRLGIVWLGILTFMGYAGAEAGAGVWAAPLFQSRGLDAVIANNQVTAYWLSFTAGRIIFGAVVTWFRTENLIRGCLTGTAAGAILLAWNPFSGADLAGIMLFGFMLAPVFAVLVTATQQRLGPIHAPNAIGFQVAAASMGAGLLPAVAGQLAAWSGLEIIPLFLLTMALAMLALYQLSLTALFAMAKKKHD